MSSLYHTLLPPSCSASPQTQNQQSQGLWTETSEAMSQNKFFPPEVVYFRYFVTGMKSLTNNFQSTNYTNCVQLPACVLGEHCVQRVVTNSILSKVRLELPSWSRAVWRAVIAGLLCYPHLLIQTWHYHYHVPHDPFNGEMETQHSGAGFVPLISSNQLSQTESDSSNP
jgi:hypothetical protein